MTDIIVNFMTIVAMLAILVALGVAFKISSPKTVKEEDMTGFDPNYLNPHRINSFVIRFLLVAIMIVVLSKMVSSIILIAGYLGYCSIDRVAMLWGLAYVPAVIAISITIIGCVIYWTVWALRLRKYKMS